jgi:hypothetical protein
MEPQALKNWEHIIVAGLENCGWIASGLVDAGDLRGGVWSR